MRFLLRFAARTERQLRSSWTHTHRISTNTDERANHLCHSLSRALGRLSNTLDLAVTQPCWPNGWLEPTAWPTIQLQSKTFKDSLEFKVTPVRQGQKRQ